MAVLAHALTLTLATTLSDLGRSGDTLDVLIFTHKQATAGSGSVASLL